MKNTNQLFAFKSFQVSSLNKISGGVKNTTWESGSTGTKYKDYDFADGECNTTTAAPSDCGGSDKTFQPA